jgi:hypothetical protein
MLRRWMPPRDAASFSREITMKVPSSVGNWLLVYCAVATTALIAVTVTRWVTGATPDASGEIDVERINVREEDGTLRMVITNSDRLPGIIHKGVDRPHPGRDGAGMLFFNEEGTENGGLIFSGHRDASGKVVDSFGHLSFDQFEQDQVVALDQAEKNGKRRAGLAITDRPDQPLPFAQIGALARATGAEKEAIMKRLVSEGAATGEPRVFVGKSWERESVVVLSDEAGRPRLRLEVTPDGEASIQFLDAAGAVVKTVRPEGAD